MPKLDETACVVRNVRAISSTRRFQRAANGKNELFRGLWREARECIILEGGKAMVVELRGQERFARITDLMIEHERARIGEELVR